VIRHKVLVFEAFLAVLIMLFVGSSFYYSPKARVVPLVVGFFSLALVLSQIIADFVFLRAEKRGQGASSEVRYVPAILFALGTGALMFLFGYYGGIGIVLLAMTKFWFKESWVVSLASTALLLLFSYILFYMVFGIELYTGFVPSLVISLLPE
jgi:uncharacterized membrane protein YfcA